VIKQKQNKANNALKFAAEFRIELKMHRKLNQGTKIKMYISNE